MLYDSSKNQLDKRFLKKDEVISSGESLTFDAYLVDIGDRMTIKEHNKEVKIYGANCEMTEKMDTITGQQRHKSFADNLVTNVQRIKVTAQQDQFWADESATREKPQHSVWSSKHVNSSSCSLGVEKIKLAKRLPSHMHLRDAQQIISILRKPTATDRTLIVEAAPVKRNTSQPSELFQLDDNHHDFQGSLPYDQPESGMLVEEGKDEKTENEGCTRKFFETNDIQFETGHDVLSARTGCHNNQARPVCTQGTQVVKSTKLVGSSLIDRLQSSAHGIQVILDSAQDFEGSLSPVKNEGGTHRGRAKKRSTDKSETAAGSTLHMYQTRCSADDHGYTEMNVKIEKSNGNFDGPSFDLGI